MWVLYISDHGDRKPDGTGPSKDGARVSTSLSALPPCVSVFVSIYPSLLSLFLLFFGFSFSVTV